MKETKVPYKFRTEKSLLDDCQAVADEKKDSLSATIRGFIRKGLQHYHIVKNTENTENK